MNSFLHGDDPLLLPRDKLSKFLTAFEAVFAASIFCIFEDSQDSDIREEEPTKGAIPPGDAGEFVEPFRLACSPPNKLFLKEADMLVTRVSTESRECGHLLGLFWLSLLPMLSQTISRVMFDVERYRIFSSLAINLESHCKVSVSLW